MPYVRTVLHRQGAAGLLSHWQPYAVAAAALVATVLLQNAYGIAPLHSSFPFLVTAEPLAGLLLGVLVLHGALRASSSAYAGETGGLVVMVLGVWLLAHSRLVTGQAHLLQRRRDEAVAFHVLGRLEAVIRDAEADGAHGNRGRVSPGGRRAAQLRNALARLFILGEDQYLVARLQSGAGLHRDELAAPDYQADPGICRQRQVTDRSLVRAAAGPYSQAVRPLRLPLQPQADAPRLDFRNGHRDLEPTCDGRHCAALGKNGEGHRHEDHRIDAAGSGDARAGDLGTEQDGYRALEAGPQGEHALITP